MNASPRLWVTVASNYLKTVRGVRSFLRTTPYSDPIEVVKRQFECREAVFLDTLRRVVFDNPANPYCAMFRFARCSYEDVAGMVRDSGLEIALRELRASGVYLSQDEFKGKRPILRGDHEIAAN